MTDQKPICCPPHFYLRQQVSAVACQIVPMETLCSVYEQSLSVQDMFALRLEKRCCRGQLLHLQACFD